MAGARKKPDDEKYSDREAKRRFMITLKTAVNTPPKPQKSMPRKGIAAQSKKLKKGL
jgi:hypothetical protein